MKYYYNHRYPTMKIVFMVFILLLIGQANAENFSENDSYTHTIVLSRDVGSRVSGSPNNEQAADYISKKFEEYGLKVEEQEFKFNSRFSNDGKEASNGGAIKGRNIIGILDGKSQKKIIIGAHYDTVPDTPGANDNAAGVGILLEIAEALADNKNFNHTIVFIAFDAEEHYLAGSSYYLQNVENPETIDFMIDIDSIGRGNFLVPTIWNHEGSSRNFFQSGYLQSPLWLTDTICGDAEIEGLNCLNPVRDQMQLVLFDKMRNPIYSMGDSGVFLEKGIPAIGLVSYKIPDSIGMNSNGSPKFYSDYIPDIHTKEDTYDKIDIQSLKRIKTIITSSIIQLDDKNDETSSENHGSGLLISFNKKFYEIPWFVLFMGFTLIPIAVSIVIFTGLKHYFISITPTFLSLLLLVIIKDSEPFLALTWIKPDTSLIIWIIFLTVFFVMLKQRKNTKLLFESSIILYLIGSILFFNFDPPRNTPATIIYMVLSIYIVSHVAYSYFLLRRDNKCL